MNFRDYWDDQPQPVRQWIMDRCGITRTYVSLIRHGRRVPSNHLQHLLEAVTGQKFEFSLKEGATEE